MATIGKFTCYAIVCLVCITVADLLSFNLGWLSPLSFGFVGGCVAGSLMRIIDDLASARGTTREY